MQWTREVGDELLAGPLPWSYAWGEWLELLEEIRALDLEGVKDEMSDALTCTWLAIWSNWGVSLPLIGSARFLAKRERRLVVWEEIFRKEGLQFEYRYLVGGSNYKRPEKVEAALDAARKEERMEQEQEQELEQQECPACGAPTKMDPETGFICCTRPEGECNWSQYSGPFPTVWELYMAPDDPHFRGG